MRPHHGGFPLLALFFGISSSTNLSSALSLPFANSFSCTLFSALGRRTFYANAPPAMASFIPFFVITGLHGASPDAFTTVTRLSWPFTIHYSPFTIHYSPASREQPPKPKQFREVFQNLFGHPG
jgi:hypothetical protein